jgi:tRNA A37 threonylcarbamoyladenosine dehydratase
MFFRPTQPDYSAMVDAVRQAIQPVQVQIQDLSAKVDRLTSDHVRREDLEKLRIEMKSGFDGIDQVYIRRDVYEQQRAQMLQEIEELKHYRNEQMSQQKNVIFRATQGISTILGIAISLIAIILFFLDHVALR